MNTKLAKRINIIAHDDQTLRERLLGPKSTPSDKDWDLMEEMDRKHSEELKEIISTYGFPTIKLVGKKASHNAWLIAQHAVHDLAFMKKYLKLLLDNKNDVNLANIAYLEDRVLVQQGKKQKFGTQVRYDEVIGTYVPHPIIDSKNVDIRRKDHGLQSLEEYLKSFN